MPARSFSPSPFRRRRPILILTAILLFLLLQIALFLLYKNSKYRKRKLFQETMRGEKSREHEILVRMWNEQQLAKLNDPEKIVLPAGAISNSGSSSFVASQSAIPIVMYVHNRPHYFRRVLQQLRKNPRISETLLIISHDGLYPEMQQVLGEELDFCQWVELVHPKTHDIATGGQYRLIYHWWWLQETIWHNFPQYDRFLFLEEDHMPSSDFYVTALYLREIHQKIDPELDYTVGFSLYNQWSSSDAAKSHQLILRNHFGRQDNTAYCYTRKLWQIIYAQKQYYFDMNHELMERHMTYGWDVVVTRILKAYLEEKQLSLRGELKDEPLNWWLLPASSRVRNIGVHGIHKFKEFEEEIPISEYEEDLWRQRVTWEPQSLDIVKKWNKDAEVR